MCVVPLLQERLGEAKQTYKDTLFHSYFSPNRKLFIYLLIAGNQKYIPLFLQIVQLGF